MADISKITLPNGLTYDLKDSTARSMAAAGFSYSISIDAGSTPAGVQWKSGSTTITGTLAASADTKGVFYLVPSLVSATDDSDIYDEYITIGDTTFTWEKIGNTRVNIDLSNMQVTISHAADTKDKVLGEATTFKNAASAVTFTGATDDKVLGEATTFTNAASVVTLDSNAGTAKAWTGATATIPKTTYTTKYISISDAGTDTFVKSYPGATSKMVTTSVPNVTNAGTQGSAAAWGASVDNEILTITWTANTPTTPPTLGTAITAATGALAANGAGSSVMTGLGTASTASAATSAKIVSVANSTSTGAQAFIASTSTSGTESVTFTPTTTDVLTDLGTNTTAAAQTITVGTNDKVTAITSVGTGTAAAQTITVGTNDKVDAITAVGTITAGLSFKNN